ncbi:MAG: type II secretion system F family protein [Anaerolineae bacterium]
MIPILLSVGLGLAVFFVYDGLTRPPTPQVETRERTRLDGFLLRAGLPDVKPREFALFSLACSLATAIVSQILLGWGIVSLLALLFGLAAPLAYYAHRHDSRRAQVQAALVEAIAQLRDAIRSGLSVQEALVGLARVGPEALRPEFVTLVRDMQLDGGEAGLVAMRDRLADPLFDIVAATLILNDRLGGRNVSQVLDELAETTRAQLRVQDELRAHQAQTVLSARVVAVMPLIVLIIIRQMNPRYLAIFNDWSGQVILALCVLSIAIGYGAMLWITRLPAERRILR